MQKQIIRGVAGGYAGKGDDIGPLFFYFPVAMSRGSKVLVDIFWEVYQGILCVDRWCAYTKYHKGLIQIYQAHLKRDCLGISKIGQAIHTENALIFSQTMENLRKRLMAIWYQFKKGYTSRTELFQKGRANHECHKRVPERLHAFTGQVRPSLGRQVIETL